MELTWISWATLRLKHLRSLRSPTEDQLAEIRWLEYALTCTP